MYAARFRIAGEGELENEWKRLSGCKIADESMEDPEAVEAARCASDGEEVGLIAEADLPVP